MKKLYNIFIVCIFAITAGILLFSCFNTRNIIDEQITDKATLNNMITSQNFVFVAQFVNPIGVRRRDLSGGGYDVSISKDTIVSYLPYFGKGYTASLSPTDVDFHFTSTKFSYKITDAKNGWNISINPGDQHYLQELFFRIFDNGRTSVNITSIDRSSVSYDGYIAAKKK